MFVTGRGFGRMCCKVIEFNWACLILCLMWGASERVTLKKEKDELQK